MWGEWCEDWYEKEQKSRVWRGEAWDKRDRGPLLSSYRGGGPTTWLGNTLGFRVVVSMSTR